MKEKLHIVLTDSSGLSSLEVSRLLPELGLLGIVETPQRLSGMDCVPDLVIAGIAEMESALTLTDSCIVLLVGTADACAETRSICVRNGFLCTERENFEVVFPAAAAMYVHMRKQRARESSLQRQLTDTKLVTRAKLLLMTRLQMSENEAHRFIEKTAMENRETRRSVALRMIRMYEE